MGGDGAAVARQAEAFAARLAESGRALSMAAVQGHLLVHTEDAAAALAGVAALLEQADGGAALDLSPV